MVEYKSLKDYKTEKNIFKNYLEEFKKKTVLVVGDVMLDSYLYGKVNRISPEAPIPVLSVTNRDYRLGGAANVALNIKSLGAKAIICSVNGNDEKKEIFNKILTENEFSDKGIIISEDRKTTVKTRIISSGQHLLRVDDEITSEISSEISNQLFNRIVEILETTKIDLILFEDYDKGVLNEWLIEKIINIALQKNILTAVDPKKRNFPVYKNVDLFKPNFKEFCEGIKIDIAKNDFSILAENALKFIKQNNIKLGIFTLSELGIMICTENNCIHFPTVVRQIADVSGAGDTVISIAGLLYSCQADIKDIAYLSNLAGGIVCEKPGVVSIKPEELLQKL